MYNHTKVGGADAVRSYKGRRAGEYKCSYCGDEGAVVHDGDLAVSPAVMYDAGWRVMFDGPIDRVGRLACPACVAEITTAAALEPVVDPLTFRQFLGSVKSFFARKKA